MRTRIPNPALVSAIAVVLASQSAIAGLQSQGSDRGMREGAPAQQAPRLNETTPPPIEELEERTMEKPARRPPPKARGAERAADHSAVVARGLWAGLDTDGDGRVSRAEGGADADFKANFEMLDANRDGFVTEDEYRRNAKPRNDGHDPARQGSH